MYTVYSMMLYIYPCLMLYNYNTEYICLMVYNYVTLNIYVYLYAELNIYLLCCLTIESLNIYV